MDEFYCSRTKAGKEVVVSSQAQNEVVSSKVKGKQIGIGDETTKQLDDVFDPSKQEHNIDLKDQDTNSGNDLEMRHLQKKMRKQKKF